MENSVLPKKLSRLGRLGRSILKRFLYSQMVVYSGFRIAIGKEQPLVQFKVEMDRYEQPFGDKVILELKFNNRFPNWFGEMVRALGLTRGAAAKYCEGMASLQMPQMGSQRAELFARKPRLFGPALADTVQE